MPKRITVIMPDETYDKVIIQAEKESRKKSPMASVLIERGLPQEENPNESPQSYQQRIADEMLKKKEG